MTLPQLTWNAVFVFIVVFWTAVLGGDPLKAAKIAQIIFICLLCYGEVVA